MIVVKVPCVMAGLDVAAEAFRQLDPAVGVTLRHATATAASPATIAAESGARRRRC